MKDKSLKHLSILGLLLLIASAIMGAVIPGKTDNKRANNNDGTLRINSAGDGAGVLSCIPDVDIAYSCTASSFFTGTTEAQENESYRFIIGDQTIGNTSITLGIPDGSGGVDQTSQLQ